MECNFFLHPEHLHVLQFRHRFLEFSRKLPRRDGNENGRIDRYGVETGW